MDFAYYIVRKKDMTILDGASDMVNAVNMGQQQGCKCIILQGCVITEVGEDTEEFHEEDNEAVFAESEIIEDENIEEGVV